MKVRKATSEEWADFIRHCPHATFFHTEAWYQVWKAYTGVDYQALLITFSATSKALLPLATSKALKGLLTINKSSPADTYGGILTKQILTEKEGKAVQQLINGLSTAYISMNPFEPTTSSFSWSEKKDFTQVIDLEEQGTALTSNWSVNHKRSLQKGQENKITVRAADKKEDWQQYFGLYRASLQRWGVKALDHFSMHLFEEISKIPGENCKLWLAIHDESIMAGCLVFYQNRHAVYWHGASDEVGLKKKAAHLLHFRIMEDAWNRGFKWYDFNPSAGLEGVIRFKAGFGGRQW